MEQQEEIHSEMYAEELATIEVTYGLYSEYKDGRPHYKHNLCQKAASDLWNECAILVGIGEMQWVNKPILNNLQLKNKYYGISRN